MEAYQQMKLSNFPLAVLILCWSKPNGIPDYVQTINNKPVQYHITMSAGSVYTIPDVRSISCWLPAEEIGVNDGKRQALHVAATRKVTRIQGPPGTGKSFIGRKLVINLLENRQLWQGNNEHLKTLMKPIAIICMKNQALDQFLESLLDTTVRVIRIAIGRIRLLEGFLMSNTKDNVFNNRKSSNEIDFFFLFWKKGVPCSSN
jgi:hypothetical protein